METATPQEQSPATAKPAMTWEEWRKKYVTLDLPPGRRVDHIIGHKTIGLSYCNVSSCCGLPALTGEVKNGSPILLNYFEYTLASTYNKEKNFPGEKKGMAAGYKTSAARMKEIMGWEDAHSFEITDDEGTHSFVWYDVVPGSYEDVEDEEDEE